MPRHSREGALNSFHFDGHLCANDLQKAKTHMSRLGFATLKNVFFLWAPFGAVMAETCQTPFDASHNDIVICDLGVLSGGKSSFAKAVSDDGSVIVGSSDSAEGERAFRWTASTGMVSLGTLLDGTRSRASDVSSDGRVIVGKSNSSDGWHSFIWTEETGMKRIETPEGSEAFTAMAVSGDGRMVVGYLGSPLSGQSPAYWSKETGVVQLDTGGSALDVNHDGSVIVGRAPFKAFRWSQTEGIRLLQSANDDAASMAQAVSGDGSVVAGFFNGNKNSRSAQWTWDGKAELVVTDFDLIKNRASGISRGGHVVVGQVDIDDHDGAYAQRRGEQVILLGGLKKAGNGFVATKAVAVDVGGTNVVGSSVGENGHRAVRWIISRPAS